MRLGLAVVILVAITSAADADDPITRHWRVRVQLIEHVETHSPKTKYNGARDEVQDVNASYSFVTGTSDNDLSGDAYGFSQDPAKDLKGVEGTGSFHRSETQHPVADGPDLVRKIDGNLDARQSSSQCFYQKQDNWDCRATVVFVATETWEPAGVVPAKQSTAGTFGSFGGGGIHASDNFSHATKLVHDRFTFTTDHTVSQGIDTNHQSITINVEPLEAATYEAVFVPDPGYDQWLPEGPPVAPSTHQPAPLGLHIELRDARTHAPVSKSFSAHLSLESSRLTGECMNWPSIKQQPQPPDQPDLYFEAAKNRSATVSGDTLSLDLASGKGGGAILVSSRDWGGYGSLKAHIVIDGYGEADVLTSGVGGSPILEKLTIPKDADGNHIADAWDQTANGGKASGVDDEKAPGWAGNGDGYTLFEEYRGFIEADPSGTVVASKGPKKRHMRFDPNKRDVFVGLAIPENVLPLAMSGIATWAQISNASVHYIADPGLLVKTDGDYNGSFPRRADAWGDGHPELFGKPQAALWVQSSIGLGHSPAHADPVRDAKSLHTSERDAGFYGSFGDVKGVTLDLAQGAGTVSGLICYTDPTCAIPRDQLEEYNEWQRSLVPLYATAELRRRVTWARAHEPELDRRFTQFVFIHELGHAAGAYHHGDFAEKDYAAHGDKSCPMRYWHMGKNLIEVSDFVGGIWDLQKPHDGGAWTWCKENLPQMRLSDH